MQTNDMVLVDAGWKAMCVRGAAALLFGLIALLFPSLGIAALLVVFAAYLVLDAVFVSLLGIRAARRHHRVWPYALEALADLLVAIAIFAAPAIVVTWFVYLVAIWAIVTGLFAVSPLLFALEPGQMLFRGLYAFLSVVLGCMLFLFPAGGAVLLVWWLAAYAFLIGFVLLLEGLARRREMHRLQRM